MNDVDLHALLTQMAAEHRPRLPSPGLMWLRAHLARKAREKERIERPLVVIHLLVLSIGALLLVGFFTMHGGEMLSALRQQSRFLLALLVLTITSLASAAILVRSPARE